MKKMYTLRQLVYAQHRKSGIVYKATLHFKHFTSLVLYYDFRISYDNFFNFFPDTF